MDGGKRVLIEDLSKKFCRTLRRSLWYGVREIAGELCMKKRDSSSLRTDEFWAVENVSFDVNPGECVALIGPNGAGKSSLLKMLNGLIKPDRGRITIRGRIGALIELGAGFNPVLTGRENLYVNASILGLSKKEIDYKFDEIVDFAEIAEFIDMPVQNYSSGMKVRLGFSIAAHLRPHILLVDEVLAVGDVGFRMKCYKHIVTLMDEGTSIILVSHNVNQLSRVTDRAVVLAKGLNVFDGSLSAGIGHYQRLIIHERENSRQTGTEGKPVLQTVRLFDAQGCDKSEFITGENISLDITIATKEPVQGARLIVAIESPSAGMLGSFSTPYQGFNFDLGPPQTTVRLILPDFPLLVGDYRFSINLYGPETTDFYDRWSPAATFRIVGPPTNSFGFGVNHIFNFRHRWEKG
jgi:lipopolysaccharide transport system ATP-binding protein